MVDSDREVEKPETPNKNSSTQFSDNLALIKLLWRLEKFNTEKV